MKRVSWITILFGPSTVNLELWCKDGEEDDDHNIADWAHLYEAGAFEDELMDDAEEIDKAEENASEDQPPDELGQVLVDSQRDYETLKESKKFEKMVEDHKKIIVSRLQAGA